MPYKHQMESYRIRDGIKFMCEADICDLEQGDLKTQAATMVKELRAAGRRAFYIKQNGGDYYRVFAAKQ